MIPLTNTLYGKYQSNEITVSPIKPIEKVDGSVNPTPNIFSITSIQGNLATSKSCKSDVFSCQYPGLGTKRSMKKSFKAIKKLTKKSQILPSVLNIPLSFSPRKSPSEPKL